jgi:hypothetical protein
MERSGSPKKLLWLKVEKHGSHPHVQGLMIPQHIPNVASDEDDYPFVDADAQATWSQKKNLQ